MSNRNTVVNNLLDDMDHFLDDIVIEEIDIEEIDSLSENDKTTALPAEDTELKDTYGLPIDSLVSIKISPDKMTCYLDFNPPKNGGKEVKYADVEELLNNHNIQGDINWSLIFKTIDLCNKSPNPIKGIVAAKGVRPSPEVPEKVRLSEKLLTQFNNMNLQDKRVDYRKISPFCMVKKGDEIGFISPRKVGKPGLNVFGDEVPFESVEIETIDFGENIKIEDRHIFSETDGRVEFLKNLIQINEVLEIQGDVNYSTGNIHFPGDVIISGIVNDWFQIDIGGSLMCKSTLDASSVRCKKDLITTDGIIGRRMGTVAVGGHLRCKFIENCSVEATKSIKIKTSSFNSYLYTNGPLTMNREGAIIGGKVTASNGVSTGQIGNKSGKNTEIHCGNNYLVQEKLEIIKDKLLEIQERQHELRYKIKNDEENKEKIELVNKKLDERKAQLQQMGVNLIPKLNGYEDARINVYRSIYPGAVIYICNMKYRVTSELQSVSFFLNKEKGVIEFEKIKKL